MIIQKQILLRLKKEFANKDNFRTIRQLLPNKIIGIPYEYLDGIMTIENIKFQKSNTFKCQQFANAVKEKEAAAKNKRLEQFKVLKQQFHETKRKKIKK